MAENMPEEVAPETDDGVPVEVDKTAPEMWPEPTWKARREKAQHTEEGFKVWDNSRFGVLENLEEESEQETQEEYNIRDRPDGPTGAGLSGRGKRPQVQVTEAQIINDKSGSNKGYTAGRTTRKQVGESSRNTERSRKHENQAADMDSHTVVRGYENGNWVETTVVSEDENSTETIHTQLDTHSHH
nr:uncharacterized protein LOC109158743 [Ipomoea trifida]